MHAPKPGSPACFTTGLGNGKDFGKAFYMLSRRLLLCLLSATAVVLLAGCGSVSRSSTSTPTPTPGGPTPTPTPVSLVPSRFVYGIIDFEAEGGFFGGQIDPSSGKVSPVPGNPFANSLGQNIVIQVVPDPQGRFLYSLNLGASSFGIQFGEIGLGAYQINHTTGALTPVPGGKVIFPAQRGSLMAVDGTGHFLYQPDGPGIDIYSIDQSTGLLTAMGSSTAAAPVGDFSAASPDGRFFFNEGNNALEVFAVNQGTGQLTLAAPAVPTLGSGGPLTVSADSRFVYVSNMNEGTVSIFSIGPGGALTAVTGSPFRTDTAALGMSLSPDGKFLYMIFGTPQQAHLQGFAVNPANGSFVPIPGASINNAFTVNVDGSGRFAYVSQGQLVTYAIDPSTGALTVASQSAQPISDLPDNLVLTH